MATMDTNVADYGGYEYHFVEEPPIDLKCLICRAVAKQPQQHGQCGKLYCLSCITEHMKTRSQCAHCRQDLTTFTDGKSAQDIKALKVRCDYFNNGCEWVGDLCYVEEHKERCGYALLFCPNECEENAVIVEVLRKDRDFHMANECQKRLYNCPNCRERGIYDEIMTTHLDTCPNVCIACPNAKCKVKTLRCDMDEHRSEQCKYEEHSCKYNGLGCQVVMTKRKLKEHEKDASGHLEHAQERILELGQNDVWLNEQLEEQKESISQLKEQVAETRKQAIDHNAQIEKKLLIINAQIEWMTEQRKRQKETNARLQCDNQSLGQKVEELEKIIDKQGEAISSLQSKKFSFKKTKVKTKTSG